jgi:hypothetical protein
MPTRAAQKRPNEDSTSSSSKSSTYQSKLFQAPSKRTISATKVEEATPNKRPKREDADEKGQIATTTDDRELVPVSREAFVSQYHVQGLQDVYYQPDWIDAKTAHRWHSELQDLKEWYRPKLKVYGREIQQSRSIAGESNKRTQIKRR